MATSSEIIYNLQLSDSLLDMRKRFDCYVTLVSKLFKRFSFRDHISIRKHILKKKFTPVSSGYTDMTQRKEN